jgi:hypothetical protein
MAQVKMYSVRGHDVLLDYDPATADMKDVNAFVDDLEKQTGGRTFADNTATVVDKITPETGDVTVIRPIAGG